MHEQLAVIGFSFLRDIMALSPFIIIGVYVFSGVLKSKTEQEWQKFHDERNYQDDLKIYAKGVKTHTVDASTDVSKVYDYK